MSSTNTDQIMLLDTSRYGSAWAVAFHPDGKHLLGGNDDGIGRWRLVDGQEIGKQMKKTPVNAISVSRNHQWIVCGTYRKGASVWDGQIHKKVFDVEYGNDVDTVDFSPDSTRFATGSRAHEANIWSIKTGQRLVGPLKHDRDVDAIRFSPNGDCIATVCTTRIRIFESYTGDKLLTIEINLPTWAAMTPLAWSNNGQQIFALSRDRKIRAFDASTGTQLAESQNLHDANNNVSSITLATNGKFIAAFADNSILFLDTSTLNWIGPHVIEDGKHIRSVAISPDSSRLATGQHDGKIVIRDLGKILPDLYGPFNVSTREDVQHAEQPPTSGDHDDKVSRSTPEVPAESSRVESKGHGKGDNGDLLEVDVSPTMPAQFDYGESLSPASSADRREDEIPPVGLSHPISQSSNFPPVTSRPEVHTVELENVDTVESPRRHSIFRKWLQRKSNKPGGTTSPELGQLAGNSREPAELRSSSRPPAEVNATKGPSWMAAGKRKRRAVAKTVRRPQDKSSAKTTVPKPPNKDASRSGQGSAGANEAGPAQEVTDSSQPSPRRVHLMHQQGSGDATLSLRFPAWIFCIRSSVQDGTH